MCFTTTSTLRCSLVSLTRCTTTLLRSGLLARTCNVALSFGAFPDVLSLVLEVLPHSVHDVTSQDLVEDVLLKVDNFASELATQEVENRHLERLASAEGPRGPGLRNHQGAV